MYTTGSTFLFRFSALNHILRVLVRSDNNVYKQFMFCVGKEIVRLLFMGVIRFYLMSSSSVIFPFPSGSSCLKLTTSLVNDLLKFQMANVRILCNANDSHILSTKILFMSPPDRVGRHIVFPRASVRPSVCLSVRLSVTNRVRSIT